MRPFSRFIAVALLVSSSAVPFGAVAEPLDKASCANLQVERKKLLTRDMQAALDRGPDWVKDHLNDQEIERVRQFLDVEAKIEFRCRGGGVAKVDPPVATPATTTDTKADTVPLPDRKPTSPSATAVADPSQALADSDKTAPSKAKATR